MANVSDFDPATDTVAFSDLLEIDQYALSRAAQLQADIRAHFDAYEFHPVVSKLQLYCSEDLGAFYLDVLKDRLYTTATKSLARRSAQTALYQITQAMLRWMAPFLSFTAEEAWGAIGSSESIVNTELLAKWGRIREIRDLVNKDIETVRAEGQVGSSLQANVTVQANPQDLALLESLGPDAKFVFITSVLALAADDTLSATVAVSTDAKCERCWHYAADVGVDAAHPTLCGRCTSNLYGDGEIRHVA